MLVLVEASYYIEIDGEENTEEEAKDRAEDIFLSNPSCYDHLNITVI